MSVAEARSRIRLAEPSRDYQALRPELEAAVLRVLASGEYVLDAEVAALQHSLAERCEVRYAVTTASGTLALVVALKAAGLGPGDEVITSPYTSISTTAAISLAGAHIRLADVHPDTLTLDPARVAAAITPRTRALVPVHRHGVVADMDGLLALGARYGLAVIEDAALALGASYRGRPVGWLATAGIVSFAPTKIVGGPGWGGALLTDDPVLAGRARPLAGFGTLPEAEDGLEGYNAQLSSVQATVLRVKLGRRDQWLERRRAIARRYDAACDRLGPLAHTLSAWRAYVFSRPSARRRWPRCKRLGWRPRRTLCRPCICARSTAIWAIGAATSRWPSALATTPSACRCTRN